MHWPVQFSHGSNSGGQSIDSAAGGASTPLSVEAHIGLLTYNVLALTYCSGGDIRCNGWELLQATERPRWRGSFKS